MNSRRKWRIVFGVVAVYLATWIATLSLAPAGIEANLAREEIAVDPTARPPLSVVVTSSVVPAPFLVRVEWAGSRLKPYRAGWSKQGWFFWTPFVVYPISSEVAYALH
jgi:hypothetical protein